MSQNIIIRIVTAFTALLGVFFLGACKPKQPDTELNLFAWAEYFPDQVIKDFSKETGIKVNYETFSSNEEMFAKLLAGGTNYDLIQPSDYSAEALIKHKLLAPLDYKKLPNFSNLLPAYLNMPHDPTQEYTIPFMISTVGIVVNTEKVTEPIRGYKDMFQPKYKNRIVVVDDGRELITAALYTLGLGINDITPETIEATRPVLADWFKLIKLFDSDSPKTALLNGDVDMGIVWGGEAAILWDQDKKFQYLLPEEGAHHFVDLLAIPANAKNKEAAYKFIDYLLRPEVSKQISDEFPYTNPNAAARKLLSKEQLENPASYPKTDRKFDTFRYLGDERDSMIDKVITDLKNAN